MLPIAGDHQTFKSCYNHSTLHERQQPNPFSYLLHHAVMALTSLAHNRSKVSFDPKCSDAVYIYQILNATQSPIGIFHGKLGFTTVNRFSFQGDQLPIVLEEFPLSFVMVLPVLCLGANTALLILYIYFRNEPSVKASSSSLSLLLFLGCYIMIIYTIIVMFDESQSIKPLWLDLCMVHVWLSGIGLSMPIILATLLIKMLRVYYIFSLQTIMKRRVYTSNCAHFIYTILAISPQIAILMLWTTFDTYHNDMRYVEHPGFITIEERCVSNYLNIWSILLLSFVILLSVAVVVVAIKSRKIRLKRFKDTKKVNLFIFLTFFIGVSMYTYWSIFRGDVLYKNVASYILYAGHIIMSILCQVLLFIPKIWPPLREKLSAYHLCFHNHQRIISKNTASSKNTVSTGVF